MTDDHAQFIRRVLTGAGLVFGLLFLFLFVAFAADVLLLAFAGILLALFLRGISDPVARLLRLNGKLAFAVVVLLLVALACGAVRLLAPDLGEQFRRMRDQIPSAVEQLKTYTLNQEWAQSLLQRIPDPAALLRSRVGILKSISNLFSTTFGVLLNMVIVLVLGLYFAFEPGIYVNGLVKLVPPRNRDHAREVVGALGTILRRWLLGRILSMTVVGVLTWIGLLALGIPLALSLSIFAALLAFIPNIGPILSVIPAVLLALLKGPEYALYVLLLYTGVQTVESYLITPVIQQHTVFMPPALLILNQIVLGLLLGFPGLLLATPLTAAVLVLIKILYVRDVLKDSADVAGEA